MQLQIIDSLLLLESAARSAATSDAQRAHAPGDGEVTDAYDLIQRLAKSRRAQQSFLRHAFRYWMGRNEFLSDSKTLIGAEKAYTDNGGSFKAMLISLLTSDSFIYRKRLD